MVFKWAKRPFRRTVAAGGSGQQRGAGDAAGSRWLEVGLASQTSKGSGGQGLHGSVRARRANQRSAPSRGNGDRIQRRNRVVHAF